MGQQGSLAMLFSSEESLVTSLRTCVIAFPVLLGKIKTKMTDDDQGVREVGGLVVDGGHKSIKIKAICCPV